MGLAAATGIGIGAIVGGGILALAGVAFATTGPATLLAFALNGCIAVLTALSFAEMSTAFPESGGTYTFAKKVLSVRSAFAFGWVGWVRLDRCRCALRDGFCSLRDDCLVAAVGCTHRSGAGVVERVGAQFGAGIGGDRFLHAEFGAQEQWRRQLD